MPESNPTPVQKRLLKYIEKNKLTDLASLLDSSDYDVNAKFAGGITLLHIAILVNDKAIEILHQRGAVLSNDSSEFISPVLLASLVGKASVVEKLLSLYPEQQQYITDENGALNTALRNQNRELVNKLFKFIENAQEKYQYTSLHQAIDTHDTQKLKVLLESEAKSMVNQADVFGYTPLHLAVMNQEPLMVEMLLQTGANSNITLPNHMTINDMAIQKANPQVISLLLNTSVGLNSEVVADCEETPVVSYTELRQLLNDHERLPSLNLKNFLESKGYCAVLNGFDMSKFKHDFAHVDLYDMSFKNCLFHGRDQLTNYRGIFENCSFQKYEGKYISFLPGTKISNSLFEDVILKHVNVNDVQFNNNHFFYTSIENSNFYNVKMQHNNFYGAQLWHVNLDNSLTADVNLMQSSLYQVNGQIFDDIATHTAPVVGIFGEISELNILSKPGFMAAEPYMRIKQSGAIPHLISQLELYSALNVTELNSEVEAKFQDLSGRLANESIVQHILHTPTEQINQLNVLAKSYADKLDALWIPGGPDIHPAFYGKEIPKGASFFTLYDDMFEFALLDQMLAQGKPVLGICHGAQLINVYFGGTLLQNVEGHDGVVQPVNFINHEGSLGSAVKGDIVWGLSAHHQAMDIVAEPLMKIAEYDGVIKAAQGKTEPVFLVQFHPEYLLDDNNANILNSFFDKTKEILALRNAQVETRQTINLCDVISNSPPLFEGEVVLKQCILAQNTQTISPICVNQYCQLTQEIDQAQLFAA